MIPFRRNLDFVGREPLISKLMPLLAPVDGNQVRAALYGLEVPGEMTSNPSQLV